MLAHFFALVRVLSTLLHSLVCSANLSTSALVLRPVLLGQFLYKFRALLSFALFCSLNFSTNTVRSCLSPWSASGHQRRRERWLYESTICEFLSFANGFRGFRISANGIQYYRPLCTLDANFPTETALALSLQLILRAHLHSRTHARLARATQRLCARVQTLPKTHLRAPKTHLRAPELVFPRIFMKSREFAM